MERLLQEVSTAPLAGRVGGATWGQGYKVCQCEDTTWGLQPSAGEARGARGQGGRPTQVLRPAQLRTPFGEPGSCQGRHRHTQSSHPRCLFHVHPLAGLGCSVNVGPGAGGGWLPSPGHRPRHNGDEAREEKPLSL